MKWPHAHESKHADFVATAHGSRVSIRLPTFADAVNTCTIPVVSHCLKGHSVVPNATEQSRRLHHVSTANAFDSDFKVCSHSNRRRVFTRERHHARNAHVWTSSLRARMRVTDQDHCFAWDGMSALTTLTNSNAAPGAPWCVTTSAVTIAKRKSVRVNVESTVKRINGSIMRPHISACSGTSPATPSVSLHVSTQLVISTCTRKCSRGLDCKWLPQTNRTTRAWRTLCDFTRTPNTSRQASIRLWTDDRTRPTQTKQPQTCI
jgi:hypothetical protein